MLGVVPVARTQNDPSVSSTVQMLLSFLLEYSFSGNGFVGISSKPELELEGAILQTILFDFNSKQGS